MSSQPSESVPFDGSSERALPTPVGKHEPRLITVPLSTSHQLKLFTCARDVDIERYLKNQAQEFVDIGFGEVFICPFESTHSLVAGFYHLAPSKIERRDMANGTLKIIPKHVPMPVYHIAALGRDDRSEAGLGLELILDASLRAQSKGGSWGVSLHASKRRLIKYYESVGFIKAKTTVRAMQAEDALGKSGENYLMYARHDDIVSSSLKKIALPGP